VRRAISICAIYLLSLGAAQADSMFRGDPVHSGVYPGAGPVQMPKVAWRFHTQSRFIASPAVAGGAIYDGDTDGVLHAIDAATGAEKWKFQTGARIVSSPAVSDGLVFFESYDGNFYALDAASGTLRWRFATGGERRFSGKHLHGLLPAAETMPDPFDVYLSSPAVANGLVYFGSGDGNVYALGAKSGLLAWKFKTGGVVHASPAVAAGIVYVGSWDTYFYALDAATGIEKWRFKTGDDEDTHNQTGFQGSAAVVGGTVYVGCRDSKFYALDAATGAKRWAYDNKGSWVVASPAVRGDTVYVSTSDSGRFYALNAATGAERFSLSSQHWPMFSSPAVAGDMAYVGVFNGKLYGIDLKKHALAWTFETDAARREAPRMTKPDGAPNYGAFTNENFYDNTVTTLTRELDLGSFLASPVVDGGVLYAASADGDLYALRD
jgi:eukaryotic-like serine/threonine-protein kinase